MPTRPDVLVIGAGVNGLTCALALADAGAYVEVVAEEVPGTTSLAAGALWGPYLVEPRDLVRGWALDTYAVLAELAQDGASGVRMTRGIEAAREPAPPPDFTDMVPDLAVLGGEQLPRGFASAVAYTAPLVDMPVYLAFLRERLDRAGARIRRGRIGSLAEAAALAPCVVNAAGCGARALADDESLFSIRGQLVVVENPGITEWFSEDTGTAPELTHWYPHGDLLVLGGQAALNDWSLDPDPAVARAIVQRCAAIESALAGARIIGHRVGLRPTRPQIRCEAEFVGGSLVVHCYGHGGAGVSLSWGCARHVQSLIQQHAAL